MASINPPASEEAWMKLISDERQDEVALKVKEDALYRLAKAYASGRHFEKVMGLLQSANPLFAVVAKVCSVPRSAPVSFQAQRCWRFIISRLYIVAFLVCFCFTGKNCQNCTDGDRNCV